MKKTIPTVLAVHVAILLLMWGGLNALGVAFLLSVPLVGCVAWLAFEQGKYSRNNSRKAKELSSVVLFRG